MKKLVPAKLRTVLACADSDSAQCQPVRSLNRRSVSQLWITANVLKNQHVSHTVDIHFILKYLPDFFFDLNSYTNFQIRSKEDLFSKVSFNSDVGNLFAF